MEGALGREARWNCPYHAVFGQLELLKGRFGEPLPEGLALFPTGSGQAAAKEAVVVALEATARAYGAP